MKDKVRFALVGCGRVSLNHDDAILHAPHAELAAVCDIDAEKAKESAEKNGLDRYYTDMEEMIKTEKPDVCCIITPSGLHAETAIKAANMGINILVEKPMDVTKEEMRRIIDACRVNGVKLGGVFQRRTFDAAIGLKKAVENGCFGKLTMGSASLRYYRDQEYYDSDDWRGTWALDGGGALMNQGIHGVDMLDWLMGGIYSVTAVCEKMHWDIEAEDTAVVLVKFKNGAIGTIECCTTAYPGMDSVFTISGSEGNVIMGNDGFYQWQFKDETIKKPDTTGNMGGINCSYNVGNYGHTMQIEDMAMAILEDREPMVSGSDAMRGASLILAIYESARTGKEVIIDDFIKAN